MKTEKKQKDRMNVLLHGNLLMLV